MAAGQGFKTFTTGEVLTAADVNGYLMQGVLVFASEAARDAAITSPQEGQFAYTKDNNSLWYYTGSAWASSGATGDIEGVTAGVGISGGGTSGTVTITNSMATAIDAKGDLVAGTGADTFSRLAVGSNDQVLIADSTTATGLKWGTPAAGGGMTLLSTTSWSNGSAGTVTVSSINQTYKSLYIYAYNFSVSSANSYVDVNPNNADNCSYSGTQASTTASAATPGSSQGFRVMPIGIDTGTGTNAFSVWIDGYASSAPVKPMRSYGTFTIGGANRAGNFGGGFNSSSAITSILFNVSGANSISGGTILIYGVN